jgi:Domain of unknown function (DUF4926)
MEVAMRGNPEILDMVELREARGDHPAGTVGAVVELFATEALVEIVDESGATIELLTVPLGALRVRSSDRENRRAAG